MKKGPGGIDYNHFLQAYNPTHAHHELDGSTLSRSTSLLPSNTNTNTNTSNVSGTKSLFQSSSFNQSQSASSVAAAATAKDDISVGTNAFATKKSSTGVNSDLKRVWHVVLKECHRADPERIGQVSRATFISALQKADTGKVCMYVGR